MQTLSGDVLAFQARERGSIPRRGSQRKEEMTAMEPFNRISREGLWKLHSHVDDIIPENLNRWLAWTEGLPGQFTGTFEEQLQSIISHPYFLY